MDKQELDSEIEKIAKSLLSYCAARTSNHFEAEDLAQDIIVEIYESTDNIRNVDAFYGFMWAVAGNVYKQWCRNKSKSKEYEWSDFLLEEPAISRMRSMLKLLNREERLRIF